MEPRLAQLKRESFARCVRRGSLQPIRNVEIAEALTGLTNDKSSGPDGTLGKNSRQKRGLCTLFPEFALTLDSAAAS